MRFYSVSEFKAKATRIIAEIEKTKEEAIITRNGKPVVLVRLVDEKEFQLAPKGKKERYAKTKRNL